MSDLKQSVEEFKELSAKADDVITADENTNIVINGKSIPSVSKQVKTRFDAALPEVNTIAKSRAKVAVDAAKQSEQFNKDTKATVSNEIRVIGEIKESTKLSEVMANLQGAASILSAKLAETNNRAAHTALQAVQQATSNAFSYLQQTITAANDANARKNETQLLKNTADALVLAMHGIETTVTALRSESVLARDAALGHANAAAVIATDGLNGQMLPGEGKSPIAGAGGKFPSEWVSQAGLFVHYATAQLKTTLSRYQRDTDNSIFLKEFEKLQTQFNSLNSKFQAANNQGGAQLDEAWFDGVHAAGKTHELPIFNQLEQAQVAEASQEEGMAEVLRQMGGSGIFGMRQYTADKSFDPAGRVFDMAYAALNIHNHPNYDGMPGMAEFTAIVNGYYVRTRHNDYKTYIPAQGAYLERQRLYAPTINKVTESLATGVDAVTGAVDLTSNTQAKYMKEVFEQSPQDCQWQMSYMEVWLEKVTNYDNFSDPTDSFRHSNAADNLRDIFDKGRAFNYSGHKNRLENLPFQPFTIRTVDELGRPVQAVVRYRINTYPVGNLAPISSANEPAPLVTVGVAASHAHTIEVPLTKEQADELKDGTVTQIELVSTNNFGHTHDIRITWNGSNFVGVDLHPSHQHPITIIRDTSGNIPFNEAKAAAGIIDNTNRFKLVRDLRTKAMKNKASWLEVAQDRAARFECVDMESLCAKIPGMNGEGAVLTESYDEYGLNDELESISGGQLNAAYYNRTYRFAEKDASGRQTAHRGFNDPTLFVAKTTHSNVLGGFSWMIPLELLLRTPRENWNPLGFPVVDYQELKTQEAVGAGSNDSMPYSGINNQHFNFGTPAGLFSAENGDSDSADTALRAWVKNSIDVNHNAYAKGIWVFTPDGHRTRFPIYSVYHDFSYASVQQAHFKNTFKALLEKAIAGTLTQTDLDDF